MRCLGIWLGVFTLGASALFAQQPVSYEFAIPEFTRTLSLAVYNESGKLVRRLAQEAAIEDFGIGLNGLVGKWDGKNDAGQFAPPGVYHLRGYALGNVEAEGAAYHFNDWAAELGDAAPISQVLAIAASPHGGVYILAEVAEGRRLLLYYKSGEGLRWSRYLTTPFEALQSGRHLGVFETLSYRLDAFVSPSLAADDSSVAAIQGRQLSIFRALTGGKLDERTLEKFPQAIAFQGGQLNLAEGDRVADSTANAAGASRLGVWMNSLAGASAGLLGADLNGVVWKSEKKEWSPLKLEAAPRVLDLAWSHDAAFWVIADEPGAGRFVGEFSLGGEFLKNLQLPEGRLKPVAISTASPSGEIYVLLHSDSGQQLLGIRPAKNSADDQPVWEIFCDKKIQDSSRFGLANGEPIAEISQSPDAHFTLKMVDPMTKRPRQVPLEFVSTAAGVHLQSADGLALDSVVAGTDIRRVAIKGGKAGTLQLYVGRHGFVEEFNLKGLNQIALLDVGEIEWPGK